MKNIIMFLIGYTISYLGFYWCYKKLDIKRLIDNKISIKIICFLMLFIFGIVSVSISDDFAFGLKYHYIFMGLFIAPMVAFIPFVVSNNKRKNQK